MILTSWSIDIDNKWRQYWNKIVSTKCVNNASGNQPKVVPELEIQAPRLTEWKYGVNDTRAAGSMMYIISP